MSVHKAKEPEKQKIDGPTHKIVDKPSNQSLVEGTCTINEQRREKTNILVSDLMRHKPGCTATEDG